MILKDARSSYDPFAGFSVDTNGYWLVKSEVTDELCFRDCRVLVQPIPVNEAFLVLVGNGEVAHPCCGYIYEEMHSL